ncbi:MULTISPECIES: FKBP-type peptidyl-prolyl cis-trans isomerase N-terminal domain-containing protein [Luteimonas]|jgi:peptidylprolyl isomerase|uniref:FKBP-type peptidyl-prolyl cis-trans isomerase N-terminal domain-containing protein n=1 Tax=Luteimonas TaxID=83614 RepID=UPI000C7C4C49|nr:MULTISPECIES: FKBP-type peptidyl-prolyl cis-trans isomerase N-terminal domain-containing protein [Luteimonas]
MKLRLIAAAVAAITFSGAALAQQPAAPAASANDRTTLSYALGFDLGNRLAETGESVDVNTIIKGLQDGHGRKDPTYTPEQMGTAYTGFQQRMQTKIVAERRAALTQNETAAPTFLSEYKAREGVVSLPSGVMYRVVEAGAGAKPSANSQVEIAYQALIVPAGIGLSSEDRTPPFRVSDAPIAGLREVLPLMPLNGVYEVVFPPGRFVTGENAQEIARQPVGVMVKLLSVQ